MAGAFMDRVGTAHRPCSEAFQRWSSVHVRPRDLKALAVSQLFLFGVREGGLKQLLHHLGCPPGTILQDRQGVRHLLPTNQVDHEAGFPRRNAYVSEDRSCFCHLHTPVTALRVGKFAG